MIYFYKNETRRFNSSGAFFIMASVSLFITGIFHPGLKEISS